MGLKIFSKKYWFKVLKFGEICKSTDVRTWMSNKTDLNKLMPRHKKLITKNNLGRSKREMIHYRENNISDTMNFSYEIMQVRKKYPWMLQVEKERKHWLWVLLSGKTVLQEWKQNKTFSGETKLRKVVTSKATLSMNRKEMIIEGLKFQEDKRTLESAKIKII